jgi:hypothetical protein
VVPGGGVGGEIGGPSGVVMAIVLAKPRRKSALLRGGIQVRSRLQKLLAVSPSIKRLAYFSMALLGS